ncbi:hypothetical protein MTR67_039829 [Solanum verrucosum]|uniref:Uncharacterized protein n=1 Tax=Solanum verrucosum TaxID=315347 RepID=A0AAF0ZRK4_SOLVR|nr:hypothetical protein MTR67_039829 [Solanum verrucosum]
MQQEKVIAYASTKKIMKRIITLMILT